MEMLKGSRPSESDRQVAVRDLPAAVDALSALAHESRLAIFRLLVQAGPSGLTVGELGSQLEIPGATLNHHLNQLKSAMMVEAEREGRLIHVRANYRRMNELLAYLYENCCQGDSRSEERGQCGGDVRDCHGGGRRDTEQPSLE